MLWPRISRFLAITFPTGSHLPRIGSLGSHALQNPMEGVARESSSRTREARLARRRFIASCLVIVNGHRGKPEYKPGVLHERIATTTTTAPGVVQTAITMSKPLSRPFPAHLLGSA